MAKARWGTRPPPCVDLPGRPPGPDPQIARPGLCALCGREAHGFAYVRELRRDRYPVYRFCSMDCLSCGSERAMTNAGILDTTGMEADAIRFARRRFAETLVALNLMEPFVHVGPAEIDRIILACLEGFREGMQRRLQERDAPRHETPQ